MALPYTAAPFFVKLYHAFINSALPAECLHCGIEGNWLCTSCTDEATVISNPTCPFCNRLSRSGKTCPRCHRKYPHLYGGRAAWYYDSAITSLIHKYKYGSITASLEFITPQLYLTLQEIVPHLRGQIILTSVPSTPRRIHRYGYNQSELLAKSLAKAGDYPYYPLLKRRSNQQSQTQLSRDERFQAVTSQFTLAKNAVLPARSSVVIIDDVLTTGATAQACATALKSAGASVVWVLAIAKD